MCIPVQSILIMSFFLIKEVFLFVTVRVLTLGLETSLLMIAASSQTLEAGISQ